MKAWKVDGVERFHRSLAARVKCTERVRWWEKEGALAKRAEREREGGPRKRTGRKEGRKEERKKGGKKEKFVRARVPCGHPWGFHSTGGSTRPLIPSFIHAARDLNR